MPEFPRKDFRLHVGWRTIKTAVSALLVNYFLPGPGRFPLGRVQRLVQEGQQSLNA